MSRATTRVATLSFPNVQGSDVFRAQAMIRSKIPFNFIKFVLIYAARGKKLPPTQGSDSEIVLVIDPKDNCVSNVPRFYGRILTERDANADGNTEEEIYSEGSQHSDGEFEEEY
jgi:hypothetical protein